MNTEKHHVVAAAKAAEEIADHCATMFENARAVGGYIAALEQDLDHLKVARTLLARQAGELLPQIVQRKTTMGEAAEAAESADPEVKDLIAAAVNALDKSMRAMLAISEGAAA